jgi:DNA-binding NtrC family response regulator
MTRHRILVVDDEASVTGALELILGVQGYEVRTAPTVREAEALLARHPFDLVFTDLRLPDEDGFVLLQRIKGSAPETEVILMTAHGSLDVEGIYTYFGPPFTQGVSIDVVVYPAKSNQHPMTP